MQGTRTLILNSNMAFEMPREYADDWQEIQNVINFFAQDARPSSFSLSNRITPYQSGGVT
jgi:hypothetical protein